MTGNYLMNSTNKWSKSIGVELQHMIAYVKCVSKKYHLTKQRRGQPKIMYLKINRFFDKQTWNN